MKVGLGDLPFRITTFYKILGLFPSLGVCGDEKVNFFKALVLTNVYDFVIILCNELTLTNLAELIKGSFLLIISDI
jgi:hypothetical protein